ncbi:hypothetical protein EWP70_05775 [Neisseria meningitidis]|nr:hypothetical protein [Neisseria meningitidis]MBG8658095.1 hypothetical protein [Neisseria meningitidis]MBG8763586.1 hypothetical protein [Neisseria meningitidis]CWP51157.1 Uncharacterised protein [Neisseria meningitidis]
MPQMPSERLQTAFFTQFPPFPIIPDNTVILKPVIPTQAGIQSVRFRFFLRFRVTLNRHSYENRKSKTETSNPVIPEQAGI